jgi:hypothetical protein
VDGHRNVLRRGLKGKGDSSLSSKGKGGSKTLKDKSKKKRSKSKEHLGKLIVEDPDQIKQEPIVGRSTTAPMMLDGRSTTAPMMSNDGTDGPTGKGPSASPGVSSGETSGDTTPTEGRIDEGVEAPSPTPITPPTVTSRFIVTQSERPGLCLGYDPSLAGEGPLRMFDCSSADYDETIVHWEKIEVTSDNANPGSNPFDNPRLFKLRHADSQLCIPQNPEVPGQPFDCFESMGGDGMVTADSINGLIDCDDGDAYPAVVGHLDESNVMYLQNKDCFEDGALISLVSFYKPDTDTTLVLWGEQGLFTTVDLGHDLVGGWIVPNS